MEGSDPISFFREIYADNPYRIEGKRSILKDLGKFYKNRLLRAFYEKSLISRYAGDRFPLYFIVAPPRTGTTFLYQLLAEFFNLSYVSNFMAPYWMAPIYAMKVQRAKGLEGEAWSATDLGNTEGALAPHEFGYFWQYWMKHRGTDELTRKELERIPWKRIEEELQGLAGFSGKPMLIKNLNYIDHKVSEVAERFPDARFIRLDRSPIPTLQSVLRAREKRYGDRSVWWSIRPANYRSVLDRPPEEQVAYQYFQVQRSLDRSLEELSSDRWIHLRYEALLEDPKGTLDRVSSFMGMDIRKDRDPEGMIEKKEEKSKEEGEPALEKAIEKFASLKKEDF